MAASIVPGLGSRRGRIVPGTSTEACERDLALLESEAKTRFVSQMTHELRTPLFAVLAFAELLDTDGCLTAQQKHLVQNITDASRHISCLLDDLVDLSQLEAGRLRVVPESIELDEIVPRALDLVRPLAEASRVELEWRHGSGVTVQADPRHLLQVLLNLVTNGVKYNRPGGTVTISADLIDDAVRVDVADTGVGIEPDDLENIFEPFERLGSERRDVGGVGLGLALTRSLVHAMNGQVTVSSQPDVGSTFSVVLPRSSGSGPGAMTFADERFGHLRAPWWALLNALPAAIFVLDQVGSILFATEQAAALVGHRPSEVVGESVLSFVDPGDAWSYAGAVAMVDEYPDVVMGPLAVSFVRSDGSVQSAEVWSTNRLDDPRIGGIVCMVSVETSASTVAEAVSAVAERESLAVVADRVVTAMRGLPVAAEASVIWSAESGVGGEEVLAGDDLGHARCSSDVATPWTKAMSTGERQIHADLAALPPHISAAASRAGYAAVWVEPVQAPEPGRGAALVLWRRRPGPPSPNQLRMVGHGASVLSVALSLGLEA